MEDVHGHPGCPLSEANTTPRPPRQLCTKTITRPPRLLCTKTTPRPPRLLCTKTRFKPHTAGMATVSHKSYKTKRLLVHVISPPQICFFPLTCVQSESLDSLTSKCFVFFGTFLQTRHNEIQDYLKYIYTNNSRKLWKLLPLPSDCSCKQFLPQNKNENDQPTKPNRQTQNKQKHTKTGKMQNKLVWTEITFFYTIK